MRKVYFLFVIAGVLFLSNSGLHPSGNTGAPGDSFCGSCHNGGGGSLDGEVTISGLPSSIQANTTYPLTITVTNPSMNAARAGFQIVALDQNNSNTGTFTNYDNTTSELRTQNGRTYYGHKPAQFYSGSSEVTWNVDWTAPSGSGGDQITIYGAAIIANGSSGNNGDRAVLSNTSGIIVGSSPLTVSVNEDFAALCFDTNDGIATALPSGGQAPYEYLWDNGENNMQATNLSGGNHEVTVTDALNETAVGTVFINSPDELTITNSGQEDAVCFGEASGLAQFDGDGGTPGYDFDWSDGGIGSDRFDLLAGFYTVTITDNNGCTASSSVTIDEPEEIDAIETLFDVQCNGETNGSILINAFGGTGNLNFEWSNGSFDQNQFDLEAGFYELTVTDDNNCMKFYQYEIVEPLEVSVNIDNVSNTSCFDSNDGQAQISANGGTPNYTFTWSDGGFGASRADLTAGTYYITVSDQNGCENDDSITINSPTMIAIDSIAASPSSCSGIADGSLEVIASGGIGSYSYLWSNGATTPVNNNITAGLYTVTVTDGNDCTATRSMSLGALSGAILSIDTVMNLNCFGDENGAIELNIENGGGYEINWSNGNTGLEGSMLAAGSYQIFATNPSGCQSNTLNISITSPPAITIDNLDLKDPLCHEDSTGIINAIYQGGNGTLMYNWSIDKTGTEISNLPSGDYILTIIDDNNCTQIDTFNLIDPTPLTIDSTNIVDLACTNDSSGTIAVFASGGTGELAFAWETNDSSSLISLLSAGDYRVSITDENNCLLASSFTVNEPEPIVIMETLQGESSPNASDGSIKIDISGGTPDYDIIWNNGQTSDSIGNLSAGQYMVTVTDENDCIQTATYTISPGDCQLTANPTIVDVSCFNSNDGQIMLNVGNNIGPISFSITGGHTNLDSLPAGNYNITITDTAFCSITLTDLIIASPDPIEIIIDSIVNASGQSNGSILVTSSGGTGNLTFLWQDVIGNDISSNEDLQGVAPGFYNLTVMDENGCTQTVQNIEIQVINKVSNLDFSIEVYPNPVIDQLFVRSDVIIESIDLYNYDGQLVLSQNVGDLNEHINLSTLKSGVYLMRITCSEGTLNKKLIKL